MRRALKMGGLLVRPALVTPINGALVPLVPARSYSAPWYVSQTPERPKPILDVEMPLNAPQTLESVCRQLVVECGLEDVRVLDARDRCTALGPAIMVVGTGKSIRHLGRATAELKSWLKHDHGIGASSEGTLTANFVRTWRRRTKRRQERQRSYAPKVELDPTLQRKTGDWIVIDTHLDGIYVHMFTADKREQIDLESLLLPREEGEVELPQQEYVQPRGTTEASTGPATRPTGRREYSTAAAAATSSRNNSPSAASATTNTNSITAAAIETINGAPLADLVACIQSHLVSGEMIRKKDLKTIFTAIAYHKFKQIEAMPFTKETVTAWRKVCDEKTRAILAVTNLVTRPLGQNILHDNDIVLLLWRAFVNPCQQSITPTSALADPTPSNKVQGFSDTRSVGFLQLLADRAQYAQPHVLVPLLCGLLNAKSWSMFWQLVDKATVTVELPPAVIDTIVAMVVKSGNEKMIVHALTSFLPALYRTSPFVPSPELKRAVGSGLDVIDGEKKAYRHLRAFIDA